MAGQHHDPNQHRVHHEWVIRQPLAWPSQQRPTTGTTVSYHQYVSMHCTVHVPAHSPARIQQLALVSLVGMIQRSLHRHGPQKQGTKHLPQVPRPQCCGQPLEGGGEGAS